MQIWPALRGIIADRVFIIVALIALATGAADHILSDRRCVVEDWRWDAGTDGPDCRLVGVRYSPDHSHGITPDGALFRDAAPDAQHGVSTPCGMIAILVADGLGLT